MDKTLENKKYPGFTLIEILIGTLIFAVVMVIVTGVVGQSVGYQSKIRAIRQTSEESRKIADIITRDVREANGEFSVAYNDGSIDKVADYDSGIALFGCTESQCNPLTESTNDLNNSFNTAVNVVANPLSNPVNTLVMRSENKIKVYISYRERAQALYYYEYSPRDDGKFLEPDGITLNRLDQVVAKSNTAPHADGLLSGSLDTWANINSSLEMKTVFLSLQYYAPQKGATKAKQVFLRFKIISELGLPTGNPKEHAASIITTTVSSRGYNH